jgi:septal ring-binding cell division protein DamX
VVGVLLALALIAVVLAIAELSRDAEGVQEVPGSATPTPAASATPGVTPSPTTGAEGGATPSPVPTPSASPSATPGSGGASASPGLAQWPEGRTAYTIVLNSSGTRDDAERLAGELATKGVPDVGVLDSNDFESLGPDSFVVFSGTYGSEAEAQQALAKIRDQAGGGSTRRIVPSK